MDKLRCHLRTDPLLLGYDNMTPAQVTATLRTVKIPVLKDRLNLQDLEEILTEADLSDLCRGLEKVATASDIVRVVHTDLENGRDVPALEFVSMIESLVQLKQLPLRLVEQVRQTMERRVPLNLHYDLGEVTEDQVIEALA